MHTDSTKKQTRAGVLPMKPIKSSARIHPVSQECLQRLCDDPTTTLCIFSGSERNRLSQAFAHLPKLWIAAENGCFIRPPLEGKDSQLDSTGAGKWITMVETANLDWLESVQLVFDYFCERTPRSYVETRETSLVWSYKYADPDFGRQQARDLLQHLWTGPISNAAVDVIQGSKSVEVRPIGVSKVAAVERIVSMMGNCGSSSAVAGDEDVFLEGGLPPESEPGISSIRTDPEIEGKYIHFEVTKSEDSDKALQESDNPLAKNIKSVCRRQVDFVMCCGHFLGRDEDIFEYIDRCSSSYMELNPSLTSTLASKGKLKGKNDCMDIKQNTIGVVDGNTARDGKKPSNSRVSSEGVDHASKEIRDDGRPSVITTFGATITCTVGRKRSGAGYFVNDSDDIAEILASLTNSLDDGKGRVELLQFDTESSLGSTRSLAELVRQSSMANLINSASLSRQGSLADFSAQKLGRQQSFGNLSDNSSVDLTHKCDGRFNVHSSIHPPTSCILGKGVDI